MAIDYGRPQVGGSITVSDPKLYRREALINERRREVRYIDQLMANTEKEGFIIGPDIAREIEVIKAIAVTAGLSFDPAAGAGYQRSQETGSIRQDIDALQLQLQLDQLKRDAALFREGLSEQTASSRDNLGAPTAATNAAATPTLTPADAADLSTRIDTLQTTLAGRLGATVAGPRSVALAANPIDQFRDRAAYRQILTSARNAASLDELHDLDGASLYRMVFQVTTLPPGPDYIKTAGIVEMRPVENSKPDDAEIQDIYVRWLSYLNQNIGQNSADSIDSFLLSNELFSRIDFYYNAEPAPTASAAAPRGRTRRTPAKPAFSCPGLVSSTFTINAPPASCSRASFVAPDLPPASVASANVNRTMGLVVDRDIRLIENQAKYDEALSLFRRPEIGAALLLSGKCELRPEAERRILPPASPASLADTTLNAAISAQSAVPLLAQAVDRMASDARSPPMRTALDRERMRLVVVADRARRLLEELSESRCGSGQRLEAARSIVVPKRFKDVLDQESVVRVYEVGPREQVQQTSTAARAAEAFSLAAAISAQAPSAGAAARAGVGYSRNAAGKVDLIERLPVIVGYAQSRGSWDGKGSVEQPRFGWLLGPRINSVDPRRGELRLQQGQKVYDLSADLAVSGWRTRLPIEVRTAWSPDWRSSAFRSAMDDGGVPHVINVDLNPSPAEFAQLTQRLGLGPVGRGMRNASVTQLAPKKVKSCMAATIVIQGDSLWRATDVIIGGHRIGGDGVAVLPDMRGITVEIPAKTNFPDISDQRVNVQVLTPYGVAQVQDALTIDGYDAKGCDKATPADGPTVTAVDPEVVNMCSAHTFDLIGADLEKLTRVRLGSADGTLLAAAAKAKLRKVSFTRLQMETIGTEIATMQFFAGDKPAGAGRAIRLTERNCAGKE